MHHKHSLAGLIWCGWFPCKTARRATRARLRRQRAAAKEALIRKINDDRTQLYELLDGREVADVDDPLLVNFARNGGTRHGEIRRVPSGEYQRRDPLNNRYRGI